MRASVERLGLAVGFGERLAGQRLRLARFGVLLLGEQGRLLGRLVRLGEFDAISMVEGSQRITE